MIQIKLKSLNKDSLNLYLTFITKILKNFNILYNITNLPTKTKKLTLLKAPHVYKSAREQFIIKNYKALIIIKASIGLNKLKLLVLNKPKTVKINIKKQENNLMVKYWFPKPKLWVQFPLFLKYTIYNL